MRWPSPPKAPTWWSTTSGATPPRRWRTRCTTAGGRALANDGDITTLAGAQGIVDAAVAAFGDVQVLVNNAGVLRDCMFLSLGEDDWDTVMRVHLRGHFCPASVLAALGDQKKAARRVDARIINTSSGAGLQGSIGQSNHVAAKGGIAG